MSNFGGRKKRKLCQLTLVILLAIEKKPEIVQSVNRTVSRNLQESAEQRLLVKGKQLYRAEPLDKKIYRVVQLILKIYRLVQVDFKGYRAVQLDMKIYRVSVDMHPGLVTNQNWGVSENE